MLRLERVMEETEFGWSLLMVGEDQSRKLADLTNDLKRPYSTSGDEKQIVSGYSYWGIEPAIAWQHATRDPYYPVMKDGIESFTQRWNDLHSALAGPQVPLHQPRSGHRGEGPDGAADPAAVVPRRCCTSRST